MFRGAVVSWYATDLDWAHWWEPEQRFIPKQEFRARGLNYAEVDPNRSTYVWKGTQDPF